MIEYDFSGKVTVVTGGASGIGEAVSSSFAAAGSDIAIIDIDKKGGKELAEELSRKNNIKARFYYCDISDFDMVGIVAGNILYDLSRIDNLITAAGYNSKVDIRDLDIKEWERAVGVNLNGTFFLIKAFLDQMLKQKKANIIIIGSATNVTGSGGGLHYAATKMAQYGLVKGLSYELLPEGIRSNIITPHIIDTPMLRKRYPDTPEVNEKLNKRTPIGRIGKPQDIAAIAMFLASEESGYICGAEVLADGGGLYYLNPSRNK